MANFCSRRRLLQMAGALAAGGPVRMLATPSPAIYAPDLASAQTWEPGTRLCAVIRAASPRDVDGIATFAWHGGTWHQQHVLAAPQVRQVLADPAGGRIFAAYRASEVGHPAGTLELLHVNPVTGILARVNRQRLALSAREPLAIAMSPQRRLLVVAAAGGVLSMLPVDAHAGIGELIAAHKQLDARLSPGTAAIVRFQGATQLQMHVDARLFRYEAAEDGLVLAGTEATTCAAQSVRVAGLPRGAGSFALLPQKT